MNFTFRPIDVWPGEQTCSRQRSRFKSSWSDTDWQLERELKQLNATSIVIQLALEEKDIRLDGKPRATSRPSHPGVVLAFDSKYGPLKYATDTFDDWRDNLRAITLGLEALRKVDRYGITKRGEQYTGWKAIGTGTTTRGEELIREHGGVKEALRATHPDRGGDANDFMAVQAVREASAV